MPVSIRRRATIAIERALDECMRLAAESGATITERKYLDHVRVTLERLTDDRSRPPAPHRMDSMRREQVGEVVREAVRRPPR